jgi:hydroxypyruvate isomerase
LLLLSICLTSLLLASTQFRACKAPCRHRRSGAGPRQIGPAFDYPHGLGANRLRCLAGAMPAHDESHQYLFEIDV